MFTTTFIRIGGKDNAEALPEPEWERRVIASWYAILKRGLEHGDSLAYW